MPSIKKTITNMDKKKYKLNIVKEYGNNISTGE